MRKKGPLWIPKNRKLELKYFTLQYYDYKRKIHENEAFITSVSSSVISVNENPIIKPSYVEELSVRSAVYNTYIEEIEEAARPIGLSVDAILSLMNDKYETTALKEFYFILNKIHM